MSERYNFVTERKGYEPGYTHTVNDNYHWDEITNPKICEEFIKKYGKGNEKLMEKDPKLNRIIIEVDY